MKGPEAKVARMEDILNLPVQDPTCEDFSAAHLDWVKVDGGRQGGDSVALVPYARVADFVKGESVNAECPARFRIESRRKRSKDSIIKPRVDCYLEYTLYWCSYGPEDYRKSESGMGDARINIKPHSGKGSRPGRRHMMRGCLCHFTVKRLYTRPLIALIIFNQRNHADKTGAPCHGILDQDAVGTRAMYAPRISEELRQKVMSMLYVGISLDNIMQHHMEEVQKHGGPLNRDDFLTRNDVRNMERLIRSASHELDVTDESSLKMWVHRHQKNVFVFHENSKSEPFMVGIQTDWQLQQMIRYGHNNVIASHSWFGLKQLKYPICSLLTFDSTRNPIPVAWIIAPHHALQCVQKWVVPLVERIRAKDPRWRPNAFFIDDPSFDVSTLRDGFQCCVLICLWHVRRACLKHILNSCSNVNLQRDMFKHFGQILYCTGNGENSFDSIEEFTQVFVDQTAFMDYFRTKWLTRIELWVNGIRTSPVASQDFYSAIEAYHQRLKLKIFSHQNISHWQRIDWLIHIMTTEIHSLYWLDQFKMETENPDNLSLSTNSWYQAMQIPDIDVLLEDDTNGLFARVVSQTNKSLTYTISNPGSEFSLCECAWARLGNVCKHIIKVGIVCKNRQAAGPPPVMLAQVYRRALLELLQNAPDDPLVLDHAILNVTRLQREIKCLEDLSDNGLLQTDGIIPEFRV